MLDGDIRAAVHKEVGVALVYSTHTLCGDSEGRRAVREHVERARDSLASLACEKVLLLSMLSLVEASIILAK